jgi:hypothetical protein
MIKVYIAGKITGEEEKARVLFEQAEKRLSAVWGTEHVTVINPMKLPHDHSKTWKEYLTECIKHLVECDVIYMLNGWKHSKGARLEYYVAEQLGMLIYPETAAFLTINQLMQNLQRLKVQQAEKFTKTERRIIQ